MFITAIKTGCNKLSKYFPRRLNRENLIRFKPYLFAVFLDPRFKTALFREGKQLYFYSSTELDICKLIKEEFTL